MSCLILMGGTLVLLKMSPFEFAENVGRLFKRRKPTMKQKIMAIQKPKKVRGIQRIVMEAKHVLTVTSQSDKTPALFVSAVALGLMGVILAVAMNNLFLVPVLAIGLALIPFLRVIYSAGKYRRQLSSELQSALSTITTSYQRSENLLSAIRENIPYLNPPILDVFSRFLLRVESIDPDIPAALEAMKPEIDDNVWQEWVDTLILCQSNRTQISTLPNTVSKLSKIRKVTNDLEYEMYKPVKGFLTMVAMVAGLIVAACALNSDWRMYLLDSTPGKISLAITALVIIVTSVRVITLNKPIEYER